MDGASKKQKQNHELPAKKCFEVRQSTLSAPPSPLRCITGYQQVVWEAQQIYIFFWGGGEVVRCVRWVGEGGMDDTNATETVDMRWY